MQLPGGSRRRRATWQQLPASQPPTHPCLRRRQPACPRQQRHQTGSVGRGCRVRWRALGRGRGLLRAPPGGLAAAACRGAHRAATMSRSRLEAAGGSPIPNWQCPHPPLTHPEGRGSESVGWDARRGSWEAAGGEGRGLLGGAALLGLPGRCGGSTGGEEPCGHWWGRAAHHMTMRHLPGIAAAKPNASRPQPWLGTA